MAFTTTKTYLSSISHIVVAKVRRSLSKLKTHLPHNKNTKPPRGSSPTPLTPIHTADSKKRSPPNSPPHITLPRPMSEFVLFKMEDDIDEVLVEEPASTEEVVRHSISDIKWGPSRVSGVL
ncbi:hypothetical protein EG328_006024 [Venturia inaequalis]|uniref:Uncharacterized protein n=1 Tax=Venturia inaequalis TaxID=5025 RepID=A0A8H3VEN3_VENIN|nr:hypothetical protein EG328_006024 [Venturia inaequalis]KAE9993981.1 hypothetical protein EG327_002021 [Venturia inaequalis]RDI81575.1 hypothetical protein Vi05172_g8366 [Venturia inaequalis]